jgi:hypothetical protein
MVAWLYVSLQAASLQTQQLRCCCICACFLQGLCRDMRLNGALDVSTKRQWLNWTDSEGRTALHHACQRNYLQVAQIVSSCLLLGNRMCLQDV